MSLRKIYIILGVEMLCAVCILQVCIWPQKQLYLELKEDTVQIETGEIIDPAEYILRYGGQEGELIMPLSVDTSSPGRKAVVYRLKSTKDERVRILYVNIKSTY